MADLPPGFTRKTPAPSTPQQPTTPAQLPPGFTRKQRQPRVNRQKLHDRINLKFDDDQVDEAENVMRLYMADRMGIDPTDPNQDYETISESFFKKPVDALTAARYVAEFNAIQDEPDEYDEYLNKTPDEKKKYAFEKRFNELPATASTLGAIDPQTNKLKQMEGKGERFDAYGPKVIEKFLAADEKELRNKSQKQRLNFYENKLSLQARNWAMRARAGNPNVTGYKLLTKQEQAAMPDYIDIINQPVKYAQGEGFAKFYSGLPQEVAAQFGEGFIDLGTRLKSTGEQLTATPDKGPDLYLSLKKHFGEEMEHMGNPLFTEDGLFNSEFAKDEVRRVLHAERLKSGIDIPDDIADDILAKVPQALPKSRLQYIENKEMRQIRQALRTKFEEGPLARQMVTKMTRILPHTIAIAGASMITPAAGFAIGAGSIYGDRMETFKNDYGMDHARAQHLAAVTTIPEAMLEYIGNSAMTAPMKKALSQHVIKNAAPIAKTLAKTYTTGFLGEWGTEVQQKTLEEYAEKTATEMMNLPGQTWDESALEIIEEAKQSAIALILMPAGGASIEAYTASRAIADTNKIMNISPEKVDQIETLKEKVAARGYQVDVDIDKEFSQELKNDFAAATSPKEKNDVLIDHGITTKKGLVSQQLTKAIQLDTTADEIMDEDIANAANDYEKVEDSLLEESIQAEEALVLPTPETPAPTKPTRKKTKAELTPSKEITAYLKKNPGEGVTAIDINAAADNIDNLLLNSTLANREVLETSDDIGQDLKVNTVKKRPQVIKDSPFFDTVDAITRSKVSPEMQRDEAGEVKLDKFKREQAATEYKEFYQAFPELKGKADARGADTLVQEIAGGTDAAATIAKQMSETGAHPVEILTAIMNAHKDHVDQTMDKATSVSSELKRLRDQVQEDLGIKGSLQRPLNRYKNYNDIVAHLEEGIDQENEASQKDYIKDLPVLPILAEELDYADQVYFENDWHEVIQINENSGNVTLKNGKIIEVSPDTVLHVAGGKAIDPSGEVTDLSEESAPAEQQQEEDPDRIPFSRRHENDQSVTVAEIQQAIDDMNFTDRVTAVQSMEDVPQHLQDEAARRSIVFDGVTDPATATAYIVADNIPSVERAEQVIMHEAKVHAGLRILLGDEALNVLLDDLITTIPELDGMTFEQAEEHLAGIAEKGDNAGILGKVIATVREWLRKIGLVSEWTDNDILALIDKGRAAAQLENNIAQQDGLQSAMFSPAPPINTPAFQNWFGDSKVIGTNGQPKIVYHGTDAGFTVFDSLKPVNSWFAEDKARAELYSQSDKIIPVYLSISNPFIIQEDANKKTNLNEFLNNSGLENLAGSPMYDQGYIMELFSQQEFIDALKQKGFDGIVVSENGSKTAAAFEPTQIKSATDNQGTFDPANPDIRFSTAKPATATIAGQTAETGHPINLPFIHNTDSATDIFGIPDKTSPYDRGFEPSGKYVTPVDSTRTGLPENLESGVLALKNPLVIESGEFGTETSWKQSLSKQFNGLTGKELSQAIKDAGFDAVLTVDNGHLSEALDLTSFNPDIARFSQPDLPPLAEDMRKEMSANPADMAAAVLAYEIGRGKTINKNDVLMFLDKYGIQGSADYVLELAQGLSLGITSDIDIMAGDARIKKAIWQSEPPTPFNRLNEKEAEAKRRIHRALLNKHFKKVTLAAFRSAVTRGEYLAKAKGVLKDRYKYELQKRTGLSVVDLRDQANIDAIKIISNEEMNPANAKDLLDHIGEATRQRLIKEGLFTERRQHYRGLPEYKRELQRTLFNVLDMAIARQQHGPRKLNLFKKLMKYEGYTTITAIENNFVNILADAEIGKTKETVDSAIKKIHSAVNLKDITRPSWKDFKGWSKKEMIAFDEDATLNFYAFATSLTKDKADYFINELSEHLTPKVDKDGNEIEPLPEGANFLQKTMDVHSKIKILEEASDLRHRSPGYLVDLYTTIQTIKAEGLKKQKDLYETLTVVPRENALLFMDAIGEGKHTKTAADDKGLTAAIGHHLRGYGAIPQLLQDMLKHAPDDLHAQASGILNDYYMEMAGHYADYEVQSAQAIEDFNTMMKKTFGKSAEKALEELAQPNEDYEKFSADEKTPLSKLNLYFIEMMSMQEDLAGNMGKFANSEEIAALRAELTDKDRTVINFMQAWYKGMGMDLDHMAEALFGHSLVKTGPYYSPAKFNRPVQALGGTMEFFNPVPGFMIPRTRHRFELDTNQDAFKLWNKHVQDSLWQSISAETAVKWYTTFNDQDFQNAYKNRFGEQATNDFNQAVMDTLNRTPPDNGTRSPLIDSWRAFFVLTRLAGNLGSMFRQASSFMGFATEIGLRTTSKHFASAFTKDGALAMKKIMTSDYAKARIGAFDIELVEVLDKLPPGKLRKVYGQMMKLPGAGDLVPTLLVGQGIYRSARDRYMSLGDNAGQAEQKAMRELFVMANMSQQSSWTINQSKPIRRGTSESKMMYMFKTGIIQQLGKEVFAGAEVIAQPKSKRAWKKFARTAVVTHILIPGAYHLTTMLYNAATGDIPDEDDLKRMLINMLMGPFNAVLLLGAISEGLLNTFAGMNTYGRSSLPIDSGIADIKKLGAALESFSDEDFDDVILEMLDVLSNQAAPIREIKKTIKNYND